jgi:hypothetical protein
VKLPGPGAETAIVPTMFPFWSTGKFCVLDRSALTVFLLPALGRLPPLLKHWYVAVPVAESVIVSVEPAESPASLKFTTRSVPWTEALVAHLMKWALPVLGAAAMAGRPREPTPQATVRR